MTTEVQREQLPVPDHFQFEWDSPKGAMRFWTVDPMHWPHGVSPLTPTFELPAFIRGMSQTARELRMPFTEMGVKFIHGYVYWAPVPYTLDPAKMELRMAAMQQQMMLHVPGLIPRWQNEYAERITVDGDTGTVKLED